MLDIATVELDLAKDVYWAHGTEASGRAVLRKTLQRDLAFEQSTRGLVVST